jgi:membrane protease YdiL (CAAX protease family)
MIRRMDTRTRADAADSITSVGPLAALALIPASFALLVGVSEWTWSWGILGMSATQIACFALPAWLAARYTGRPAEALGLIRPSRDAMTGAALVAVSYWYLSAALLLPLVDGLVREEEARQLLDQFAGPQPILLKVAAFCLLPAFCEELLFRGAIARGLGPRLGLVAAALVSSTYFALLHGSLARLPITFCLGLALAMATLRTGSVLPAMLIHAGNNAAAVLLTWPPMVGVARLLTDGVAVALPLALVATTVGLTMLWRGGRDRTALVSDATSL